MPIFSFLLDGKIGTMVAPRGQQDSEGHILAEVQKCLDAMIFTVTDRVAAAALFELNNELQSPPCPADVDKFGDFVGLFRHIHVTRRTVAKIMEPDSGITTLLSDLLEMVSPIPSLEQGLHNAILDGQTRLAEENLKEWPDLSERTDDGDVPIHLVGNI